MTGIKTNSASAPNAELLFEDIVDCRPLRLSIVGLTVGAGVGWGLGEVGTGVGSGVGAVGPGVGLGVGAVGPGVGLGVGT